MHSLSAGSTIIEWDEVPSERGLDGSTKLLQPLGQRLAIDWSDTFDAAVRRVDDSDDGDYLY